MSSDETVLCVERLSKSYHIYPTPRARLKQFLLPSIQRVFGLRQSKWFRDFLAVQEVSFSLKRGEALGIIGRNGSGKSTLLQIIAGTLTPTSGRVELKGKVAALLELGAGFNPEFTGRENVYMAASLYGLSEKQIDARFPDIVNFSGIPEHIDQPVKTYSSGMYVRLAMSVVAHVDADVLIIDEALAVGDAVFAQRCMRFIRRFREHGTLIFVSHDTSSVINLCDRAIWMEQGRVTKGGKPKDVCDAYLNSLFKTLAPDPASDREQISDDPSAKTQVARVGDKSFEWRDQRADLINESGFRNDLEIFSFEEPVDSDYGGSRARITNVVLKDSSGNPLSWAVGGELVCLTVEVGVESDITHPIVGFYVRDRLGQCLFGDNTYVSFPVEPEKVQGGARVQAEFHFYMPWLAPGDYVISAAIAEGTQSDHSQLHWVHDALVFRSHHSPLSTGIVGIPMREIQIHVD